MRKLLIIAAILISSISTSLPAQDFDQELALLLQAALDETVESYNLIGVSAAISIPGQGTWLGPGGMSDPVAGEPIEPEMIFGFGSITKTFTSAMILQLAEEGQLTLEDPLSDWLPDYQYIDNTITIRQLLSHTSGIYNFTNNQALWDSTFANPTRFWQPEEVITTFLLDPAFPPGSNWGYSNTNYCLLGMIVEAVTQSEFTTELENRIIAPLQLNNTFLETGQSSPAYWSHNWSDINGDGILDDMFSFPKTAIYSVAWAAGAMASTAEDIAHWTTALFGGQVINQESLQQMLTFHPTAGYGLGVMQYTFLDHELWGHAGGIFGYRSLMVYLVEDNVSFAYSINRDTYNLNSVIDALLEVYLDWDGLENEVENGLTGFGLSQNYPNPFMQSQNPQTTIRFKLPSDGAVQLSIYDVSGRLVKTLIDNDNHPAGLHEVGWTGTDRNESPVAAGTYFYRISAGSVSQTKRMVILK